MCRFLVDEQADVNRMEPDLLWPEAHTLIS